MTSQSPPVSTAGGKGEVFTYSGLSEAKAELFRFNLLMSLCPSQLVTKTIGGGGGGVKSEAVISSWLGPGSRLVGLGCSPHCGMKLGRNWPEAAMTGHGESSKRCLPLSFIGTSGVASIKV